MGFWILAVIAAAVTVYGLLGLSLFLVRRRRQYGPTHHDSQGKGKAPFHPWRTRSGDFLGDFRAPSHPRRLVLLFHGSSGEALDRSWSHELVSEQDLLVLVEYPGYGARPGTISETALLADSVRVVQAAQETWGKAPVLALGEGLGASVAAYLASLGKVDRLALISPFVSEQPVHPALRFYPWLKQDSNRERELLKQGEAPLHVVHGTLDEFTPLQNGRAVVDEVPGFSHTNLVHAILHSPFTSRFRQFIVD